MEPPFSEPFRIDVRRKRERTVILPFGEIDLATVPDLSAALDDAGSAELVELDLTHVTFLDSSGLQAILQAHEAARVAGREFRLTGATPTTRRLLRLTGVADVIDGDDAP